MVNTDPKKISEFLDRGVANILPNRDFVEQKLHTEILRVYLGIDPTGPTLHIGHAIALKKLAQLQQLGHKIILLMGDFTARIGDPTDKSATRKTLTSEEITENLKNYKQQASKIISFDGENPAEIVFNNDWLGEMKFKDVLELCSKTTVQQLLERDMFQNRLKEEKPIYTHEMLYPLMQGYDSVALMVDGEIGGNDQLFNMLIGRDLLKEHGKDKFVMTVKLLADQTGKKMGKSEGNMITLDDSADDMFGKIMSWTDGMIIPGFELCTNVSVEHIQEIENDIKNGKNPIEYKKQLAREIITLYHSADQAIDAQNNWEQTFSHKIFPEDAPIQKLNRKQSIIDWLVMTQKASSKSDARRLIKQGSVKIIKENQEEKISDPDIIIEETTHLKIGPKNFLTILK